MQRIKKIGALSLAYMLTWIYFIIGIILAIIIAMARRVPDVAAQMGYNQMLGGWNLIFLPIIYAIMGFIQGVFIAILYNLIAKRTGGIALEISGESKPKKKKK